MAEREYVRVAPFPGSARYRCPPLEAIVGEAFTMRDPNAPTAEITGAVVTAPGGSSAEWSGASFTCAVPGFYVLSVTTGGQPAVGFRVVAFPAAALTYAPLVDRAHGRHPSSVGPVDPRSAYEVRSLLRQLAGGAFGAFDFAALTLTDAQPIPVGVSLPR
jgi:hypothetical protein